ncbi:MAG: YciK family oxidoreductase [Proteobacteria bacterium]|nr:YciK family oxidoreductase [Pseudomonadota bacterium]
MFDPRKHQARPDELAGRVIAITGASDGIGRAVARACALHGAQVVLLGRNAKKLEAVHAELARSPAPPASIAVLDLEKAVARDYDAVADALLERYGRLDGLLHNASLLGTLTPIEQYDVPTWCRVLHVNVTAAFALTQVLLPALRQSQDAAVLFTSSSVGRHGRAYWGAYSVSKFAVEGLTQVLSAELEGITQVRVNAINPGRTRTAMRRQAYPAEDIATLPEPQSLVAPYLALLGPASRGISGGSFDAQASDRSVAAAASAADAPAADAAAVSAASSSGLTSR